MLNQVQGWSSFDPSVLSFDISFAYSSQMRSQNPETFGTQTIAVGRDGALQRLSGTGVSSVLPRPAGVTCCHMLFRAVMSRAQPERRHHSYGGTNLPRVRGADLGSGLGSVAALFIKQRGYVRER